MNQSTVFCWIRIIPNRIQSYRQKVGAEQKFNPKKRRPTKFSFRTLHTSSNSKLSAVNAQPISYKYMYVYAVIVFSSRPKPQILLISFYRLLFSIVFIVWFSAHFHKFKSIFEISQIEKNMHSFNGAPFVVRSTMSIKLCIQYGTAMFCSPFFRFLFSSFNFFLDIITRPRSLHI